MKITEDLLDNKMVRPMTKLKKVKAIVVHYTGNTGKGANARANRNYWNNIKDKTLIASAHYVIDNKEIILAIPEDEKAYHVGSKTYKEKGKALFETQNDNPNNYTIGIEMCVNSDGDFGLVYKHTVELCAELLKKYNLTIDNLLRHYDITGKICPAMLIKDEDWNKFKERVAIEMKEVGAIVNVHTVEKWDTLYSIAEKYYKDGMRYKEIMDMNGLKTKILKVGQIIKY